MANVREFPKPLLDGEHVLATDPPLARETGADWRRRPRAFTGRALTHHALEAQQVSQAAMQRLRGQSVSSGTLSGLSVTRVPAQGGLDPARLSIGPGAGLARSGEDIRVNGGLVDIRDLRVMAPPEVFEKAGDGSNGNTEEDGQSEDKSKRGGFSASLVPPRPRVLGPTYSELTPETGRPRLAVLMAQPVTVELPDPGVADCPPDLRDIGWLNPSRVDGARLVLYAWPDDVRATRGGVDYDIDEDGPLARNRIAHRIFTLEAMQPRGAMHPWEMAGVPLALCAFDAEGKIDWIDAACVQRRAGRPLMRSCLPNTRENPLLIEARQAQLAAHLAELEPQGPGAIAQQIAILPPTGILPGSLVNTVSRSQGLLSDAFDTTLTPALAEEVDRLIAESAGLAPIALDQPEKIELLLPVPAHEYETDLLKTEVVDPRFAKTRDRLMRARAAALQSRENMRRRFDTLGMAARGLRGTWPGEGASEGELAPGELARLPHDTARGYKISATANRRAILGLEGGITLDEAFDGSIFAWLDWEQSKPPAQLGIALITAAGTFTTHFGAKSGALGKASGDGENHLGDLPKHEDWQRMEFPFDAFRDEAGKPWQGQIVKGIAVGVAGGTVDVGAFGTIDASGNLTYLYHGYTVAGRIQNEGDIDELTKPKRIRPRFGTAIAGDLLRSSAVAALSARWPQPAIAEVRKVTAENGLEGAEEHLDVRLKRTNDAIDVGFVRARADIYRLRQYILGRDEASRLVTSPALADLAVRDESARANADDLADFLSRMKSAQEADEKKRFAAAKERRSRSEPEKPSKPAPKPGNDTFFLHAGVLKVNEFLSVASPTFVAAQPITKAADSSTMLVHKSSMAAAAPNVMAVNPASSFHDFKATHHAAEFERSSPRGRRGRRGRKPRRGSSVSLGSGTRQPTQTGTATRPATSVAVRSLAGGKSFFAHNIAATQLGLLNPKISASDIVGQKALPGVVERTVTVAERIRQSAAAKTHEYALAGKLAVVNTLTRLIAKGDNGDEDTAGIVLADLPAPGFALRKKNSNDLTNLEPATLGDMAQTPPDKEWIDTHNLEVLKAAAKAAEAAKNGQAVDDKAGPVIHETDYFSAAVAAIDDAIALMRLVEGRVDLFEKLLADIRRTLRRVRADADKLEAALDAQDAELAEIQHDLSVAEALEAEERIWVKETNARRADVIARYSDRLVFRRPRLAPIVTAAASAQVFPANPPDPVITCLNDHADQPEELREYCALFHDAPVGWFPEVSATLEEFDRIAAAQKMLAIAIARASALPVISQVQRVRTNKGIARIHARLAAQQAAVQARRARTARLDMRALARYDLAGLLRTMREATSMGDLVDGSRGRPTIASQASLTLQNLANVAACLHATFGRVDPALRMRWAQIFSIHDEVTPGLSTLGGLPGWGSLSIDLRRELQDLVDWLFARVDDENDEAVDAIDDLVRIALLLAAHAPADELVPASLVEPVPLRTGGLVPLRIPVERVRLGQMGMIRDRMGRTLATIRAETITPTHVQARITRDFGLAREVTLGMPIALGGLRKGR